MIDGHRAGDPFHFGRNSIIPGSDKEVLIFSEAVDTVHGILVELTGGGLCAGLALCMFQGAE